MLYHGSLHYSHVRHFYYTLKLLKRVISIFHIDVFPLDKIYHLWDKLLVGPSSLPLFAGIAILRQIRDTLLGYEFNDCIVLFSDSFPKVDIEKCVQSALNMCKVTPPSVVARVHGPKAEKSQEVKKKGGGLFY